MKCQMLQLLTSYYHATCIFYEFRNKERTQEIEAASDDMATLMNLIMYLVGNTE